MGHADHFRLGTWAGRCQECAEKFYFSELRKRWDGFWVCRRCFENRQPQDFIRGMPDRSAVPASTSNPPWIFVGTMHQPGTRVVDAMIVDGLTLG
jgi:hypothetical protein